MVVCRPVPANAVALRRGDRVDIRAEIDELPAALAFLVFNHPAHLFFVEFTTGVFHAVGRDYNDHMLGTFRFGGAFLGVADLVDGLAHRIQQRRIAALTIASA